jgi:hypothetical protein
MWVGFSCPHFYTKNMRNEKQLQDALVGKGLWGQWKDKLKSKYDNTSEIYLDELFNNWQD